MKMKHCRMFALALVLCFLPSFAQAEESTPTTTEDVVIIEESIETSTTTDNITETVEPEQTIQMFVRYENMFAFDGRVSLTSPTSSVLAALQEADATSTAFSLSDVIYYESFDSY